MAVSPTIFRIRIGGGQPIHPDEQHCCQSGGAGEQPPSHREDGVVRPVAEGGRGKQRADAKGELATETDECAQFMVEEHGNAVYAFQETGSNAVRTDPDAGSTIPLNTISAGEAIMSE